MKVYRKQLHSLEELKQEKARLLLLREKTEQEDLFSMEDIIPSFGKKKTGGGKQKEEGDHDEEGGNAILDTIQAIVGDIDIADLLPKLLGPLEMLVGKKLRKKVLLPMAKEILGGYLKWKAAALAFKAVEHIIRSSREKKRRAKED